MTTQNRHHEQTGYRKKSLDDTYNLPRSLYQLLSKVTVTPYSFYIKCSMCPTCCCTQAGDTTHHAVARSVKRWSIFDEVKAYKNRCHFWVVLYIHYSVGEWRRSACVVSMASCANESRHRHRNSS